MGNEFHTRTGLFVAVAVLMASNIEVGVSGFEPQPPAINGNSVKAHIARFLIIRSIIVTPLKRTIATCR